MKENLYDINIAKAKLKEYMKDGIDPELCIKINNEEYMIIPLKDKISFQWIGKTEELFFDNVENLFESNLIM